MTMEAKNALILIKSPPCGTLRASEGLRAAMGLAVTGVATSVLFIGDGVFCSVGGQRSDLVGQPSLQEILANVLDCGAQVYWHRPSFVERQLPVADPSFTFLEQAQTEALVHNAGAAMVF